MALGFRGDREQLDQSDYVVHFTKPGTGALSSDYHNFLGILGEQRLRAGDAPFGIARHRAPESDSQKCVCFSEVPLGFLKRLTQRRSLHGIAFPKEFILGLGGAPVWYLQDGGSPHSAMEDLVTEAVKRADPLDPIWKLTPFVDVPSGPSTTYNYRFEWEREWRVAGDVDFSVDDVAFLFIDEALHASAWSFFHNAVDENIGPGYFCPYIDPRWTVEKVQQRLSRGDRRE